MHVSRGSLNPPHDHGAVAVIDGKTAKITPIRTANVPPPMSLFDIDVDANIIDVAFSHDNSHTAVLHHAGIDMFAWQTKGSRSLPPKLVASSKFAASFSDMVGDASLQISLSTTSSIHVLHYRQSLMLSTLELSAPDDGFSVVTCVEVPTGSIFVSAESSLYASLQDPSGRLRRISSSSGEEHAVRFPLHMPWFEVRLHDGEPLAVGLSRSGHLYANERQLVKNCTSFAVTPDHIVFTTTNHLIKFIHLDHAEGKLASSLRRGRSVLTCGHTVLDVPPDDPEKDERCRSVERGSKIVTAIPTNMSIVLQMPRGNLETIYPRTMVLAGIRKLIDDLQYGQAFACCRTQRVDMNILYDYKPGQFLEHVGTFLDQLQNATYIDLFLSSLRQGISSPHDHL